LAFSGIKSLDEQKYQLKIKPKILILTEWFVPGYKAGGPIKSCFYFAQNLSDYYDIHVLTTNKDFGDDKEYSDIKPNEWIGSKDGKYTIYYLNNPNKPLLLNIIKETSPDYIYINSMFSFYFSILPIYLKYVGSINSKLIITPRGMLHQGALKYKSFKKNLYLFALNLFQVDRHLIFQATDFQEQKDILRYFPNAINTLTIPNFILHNQKAYEPIQKDIGILKLVFISRVSAKKNLLFLLQILQHVDLNIDLTLVGPIEDPIYWSKCKNLIEQSPVNTNIRYAGSVASSEVSVLLNTHHAFVLPSYGENFGHSIYEALSHGRPVLISNNTPWRNLEEKNVGWDIELGNKKKWIETIIKLVEMNQNEYDEMSKNAYVLSENYQNTTKVIEQYKKLFS